MNKLIALFLLLVSNSAFAVDFIEFECVVKSVYHEGRSATKKDWLKIANVVYNRKIDFKKHKYGAKSGHMCDIVKSKEFNTHDILNKKIREMDIYDGIRTHLKKHKWTNITTATFFKTRNGQMYYS